MTTPLNTALGRSDAELTIELVQGACDQSLQESEDLDFKAVSPLPVGAAHNDTEVRARSRELAKDIAAMANGRGGLLIYGVREEGHRAVEIVGVGDLSDGELSRRIHQVAYNLIYPPVRINCHEVTGNDLSVLVVEVQESEDAPHLVQPRRDGTNDGWLIAPYRSGHDTQNMLEKQIEGAYRQRIDGRRRRQLELRELHDELRDRRVFGADAETGTVVALARPLNPRRAAGSDPQPDRVATLIRQAAMGLATQLAGQRALDTTSVFATLLNGVRPRRSLRRYVFVTTSQANGEDDRPLGRPAEATVEVHDDGTVGLTWRRGGLFPFANPTTIGPPAPSLGERDMDMVAITLLSLILTTCEMFENVTDYQLRVAIAPQAALHLIPETGWVDADLRLLPPSPVVEAEVRLTASPEERAGDMYSLGLDLSSMVERGRTAMEAFWELPANIQTAHPLLELADHLFGGRPDHPVSGRPMT